MLQMVFGISAREALFERPAWELDNLIAQHRDGGSGRPEPETIMDAVARGW